MKFQHICYAKLGRQATKNHGMRPRRTPKETMTVVASTRDALHRAVIIEWFASASEKTWECHVQVYSRDGKDHWLGYGKHQHFGAQDVSLQNALKDCNISLHSYERQPGNFRRKKVPYYGHNGATRCLMAMAIARAAGYKGRLKMVVTG